MKKTKKTKKHPTFEEAAEAFLRFVEVFEVKPEPPSREHSELRGSKWHLRNARGPLARVNRDGDMDIKINDL